MNNMSITLFIVGFIILYAEYTWREIEGVITIPMMGVYTFAIVFFAGAVFFTDYFKGNIFVKIALSIPIGLILWRIVYGICALIHNILDSILNIDASIIGLLALLRGENPYNTLGLNAYGKKKNKKALEYFSMAINSNPNIPEFYLNRGGAYANIGDVENARLDIDRAIVLLNKMGGNESLIERARKFMDNL